MLVFFKPPALAQPVELEGLGTVRVFLPQDQIWKKVTVQLDTFALRDPYDRSKELMRKNEKTGEMEKVFRKNPVKRWIVDEEETKKLKAKKLLPPPDTYEISQDEWMLLQQGKTAEKKNWFKKTTTVGANQQLSYDKMQAEHEARLSAMQAEYEAKTAAMAESLASVEAKMADAIKKQESFSVGESRRRGG